MTRSPKKWRHESFLDAITNEAVGLFDLTVCLWMSNGCKSDIDPSFFTELHEFSRSEVGAIISDDAMRDPESTGDHLEEIDSRNSSLVCDGYDFNPLGELVDCNQQVGVIAVS